ncbi:peritrophin-1-like [Arctopsyche grandis]|uniref:peritrophin-1-like n=1 Tax=Arctopsyche grandis TaxID=121162 RepID=UPI00406D787C
MNGLKVLLAICMFVPMIVARENPCLNEGVNPDGELLPHETSCNMFYICASGKPAEFQCPENLEFNPITKQCDWPESSGCGERFEAVPPCNPPGAPICPPHVVNKPAVYLPHENDCRKFYQCDWEVPHKHTCPEGLHFSVANSVCDYPERAQCACLGI